MNYPGAVPPPVIPFWPLTLGQLFSGTFAAVRVRAAEMFTIAVSAAVVLGLVTGLSSAIFSEDLLDPAYWDVHSGTLADPTNLLVSNLVDFAISLLSGLVMLVVAGLLTLLVVNAVVGKNLTSGQTWRALTPNFWRLLGATLLSGLILSVGTALLVGAVLAATLIPLFTTETNQWVWILLLIVGLLAVLAALVWVTVRLLFVPQAVVVEAAGPMQALRRSWQLTRGAFWRVLGRQLLWGLILGAIVGLVVGTLTFGLALGAVFADWSTALVTFLITFLSMLATGVTLPYSSAYQTLMYVDERIRSENLGPALAQALTVNRDAEG